MSLPLPTSEDVIAEEKTMIRKSNDVWVLTIRKGIAKLKSVVNARNHILNVKVVRENGKPILKVELEPKQNE